MSSPLVTAAVVAGLVLVLAARLAGTPWLRPTRRAVARPDDPPGIAPRRRRWRRRPPAADEAAVAQWCEQAARALRGGASLSRAMADASAAVPAAAAPFAPALRALSRGRTLPQAIADLETDPSRPAGLVSPVLHACAELGGASARALERAALALHGRAAERAERHAAAAQARLSARVLTLLPVGTLGLLTVAEERTRVAAGTPLGLACVTAGLAANALGWWWMHRIVGRAA
jgi:tight adherence protein B